MPGAALLASLAAMRAGAGLVTLAVPKPLLAVFGARVTIQTLMPLPAGRDGSPSPAAAAAIVERSRGFDAVAMGPGLGANEAVARCVRAVVEAIDVPLVLDADALNVLAPGAGRRGALARIRRRRAATVLTPHPGEMARLLGVSVARVESAREEAAWRLQDATGATVLLKGHRTLVLDAARARRNTTGNPGMATGGSGDVLTGIVAAFLARGLAAFDAAALGAHVHGLAGDLAAARLGPEGMVATDLLDELPAAMRRAARRGR